MRFLRKNLPTLVPIPVLPADVALPHALRSPRWISLTDEQHNALSAPVKPALPVSIDPADSAPGRIVPFRAYQETEKLPGKRPDLHDDRDDEQTSH